MFGRAPGSQSLSSKAVERSDIALSESSIATPFTAGGESDALQTNLGTKTGPDGEGFSGEIVDGLDSRRNLDSVAGATETLTSGIDGLGGSTSKPQVRWPDAYKLQLYGHCSDHSVTHERAGGQLDFNSACNAYESCDAALLQKRFDCVETSIAQSFDKAPSTVSPVASS